MPLTTMNCPYCKTKSDPDAPHLNECARTQRIAREARKQAPAKTYLVWFVGNTHLYVRAANKREAAKAGETFTGKKALTSATQVANGTGSNAPVLASAILWQV